MTEKDIQSLIQIELSKIPGVTSFRNNTGVGWQGTVLSHKNGIITLANARPLRAGLHVGSSDLIGWHTNNGVARFVSLEVKTAKGRLRPEQEVWLDIVSKAGGIAGVVRSPEEAVALLK